MSDRRMFAGSILGLLTAVLLLFQGAPAAAQLNCTEDCDPTIALVPVAASGSYRHDGDGIIVGPGAFVYLEIRLAHWGGADGSRLLSAYQVTLNPSSFSSGQQGELTLMTLPCLNDKECSYQTLQARCADGHGCCIDGTCASGYLKDEPSDFVFVGVDWQSQLEPYFVDGRVSLTSVAGGADPGIAAFAGTVLLKVPEDAVGTFVVSASETPTDTFLTDTAGDPITPIFFESATISVAPGGAVFTPENRFLPIHVGRRLGVAEAIRVRMADLDGDFAAANGTTLWVGEPKKVSARAGDSLTDPPDPGEPFIWVAELGCSPWYMDWTQFAEPIHLYHELIVPNSIYEVQLIFEFASPNFEPSYSVPVRISTPRWGDVAGPFDPVEQVWTGPDGSVDVTSDVLSIIDRFRGLPSAPVKTRVDLDNSTPDGVINITDVLMAINAFQGLPYPFAPSGIEPCS